MPKQIKANLPEVVRNVSCGVLHDFGWGFWVALDGNFPMWRLLVPPWAHPSCEGFLEIGFTPWTFMDEDGL